MANPIICGTCGVEHAPDTPASAVCAICADDRQYLPADGKQRWTSLEELAAGPHEMHVTELQPDAWGLVREPAFGINQQSVVVRTEAGNLLWDPPNHFDDVARKQVEDLGGIAAIVASHPHMYGSQVTWSEAFGGVPVYVNEDDREWVQRPDPVIRPWRDSFEPLPGITVVQVGGHFAGLGVAVWHAGAGGRGVVLSGDAIVPVSAAGWATFLRSYPNRIPLSATSVRRIVDRLEPYEYDQLYGLAGGVLASDAKAAVRRSAERYAGWVNGDFDHLTWPADLPG